MRVHAVSLLCPVQQSALGFQPEGGKSWARSACTQINSEQIDSLCTPLRIYSAVCSAFFFKDFVHLFLVRREGREKEEEKHRCERETSIGCLSYASCVGTKPATQACALTQNQTGDFLFCGRRLAHWATRVRSGVCSCPTDQNLSKITWATEMCPLESPKEAMIYLLAPAVPEESVLEMQMVRCETCQYVCCHSLTPHPTPQSTRACRNL